MMLYLDTAAKKVFYFVILNLWLFHGWYTHSCQPSETAWYFASFADSIWATPILKSSCHLRAENGMSATEQLL